MQTESEMIRTRALAATQLLSRRQYEVLKLASYGLRNHEIAELLEINETTVHSHRYIGMKTLGARSIAQVAILFTLAGLITTWEIIPRKPISPLPAS